MSDKSKIIVDEDWKSQVQAEKAKGREAEKHEEEQPLAAAQDDLPPASLAELITMLATQALVSLGQIEHPLTGKPEIRLPEAKHMVDLLQVLEQKTEGNRTPEETAMLRSLLHQLRMGYITAGSEQPAEAE